MGETHVRFLESFSTYMRTDIVAIYHPPSSEGQRGTYSPQLTALGTTGIQRHLEGVQPLGLYILTPSEGTQGLTRTACIDIDDKKKVMSFVQLCEIGDKLSKHLAGKGMLAWPIRSSSGHGVHLWFFWPVGQLASVVRKTIKDAISAVNPSTHIDIYPAQDKLGTNAKGEQEKGNLVALPLGRSSRPIYDLQMGLCFDDLEEWAPTSLPMSAPLSQGLLDRDMLAQDAGKGGAELDDVAYGPVDLDTLRDALRHVDNDTYEVWMRVGMILKRAAADGQITDSDGERVWEEWASTNPKFNPRDNAGNWRSFQPNGSLQLGTIWYWASQGGWKPVDTKPAKVTRAEVESRVAAQLPRQASDIERQMMVKFPWLTGGAQDDVAEMNKDHFIALEGGKAMIFREGWDEALGRNKLTRMRPFDFKLIYQNQKIVTGHTKKGAPIVADLGTAWLDDPYRRQYEEIVLRPEGCEPWLYNLWRGWTTEPSSDGSCELFKEHIFNNVCGGVDEIYTYVLNWCAQAVQKPYEPIGTAIVLRGDRGTGKGTFARVFGELFGQHFLHLTNSRDLTGRFNSHLQDCILLFADEAVWAGSKTEESTLKGIITEPYLSIEGKGRDLVQTRNMIHLIIATNSEWSIPAGMDERRFLALHMRDDKKQNTAYFTKIREELAAGGRARFLHELLSRDISKFSSFDVPKTDELFEQKTQSMDPFTEWWFEKLQNGHLIDSLSYTWEDEIPVIALYLDFVQFCRLAGYRAPKSMGKVTNGLKLMLPKEPIKKRIRLKFEINMDAQVLKEGQMATTVKFSALEACRSWFDKKTQRVGTWESVEIAAVRENPRLEDDKPLL